MERQRRGEQPLLGSMRHNRMAHPADAHAGLRKFEARLIPTVAIFTLLTLAVILGYQTGRRPVEATVVPKVATPVISTPKAVVASSHTPAVDPLAPVVASMETALATQPDLSASATLIDLATGTAYNAGHYADRYTAASTSKLVAVFDYIHQVEPFRGRLRKISSCA
jgi:hypothetical protein